MPRYLCSAEPVKPAWEEGNTVELQGVTVKLSRPVLVARSRGYLWFPTLMRLADGDLLALMSNYADAHVKTATAMISWSGDNGLTWSEPKEGFYGDSSLRLPGGDQLLLPYYLTPRSEGAMGAAYQVVPKGKRELRVVKEGLSVTGWPRAVVSVAPELGLAGFVFNGNTVELKDGSYLATLYGTFKDTKRYSLVAAESRDGIRWRIRSTIADENCKLPGKEGACESSVCRLRDGRVMCLFRMNSNVAYGQVYSSDEGKTWTEPRALDGVASVQPSLAVLKDGTVVLSGGRPGIYVWVNLDGTGKDWQRVDVLANHNAFRTADAIKNPAAGGNTSSYTEVVPLDESNLLCIYDRIPHGWHAIPKESRETNSVWVVRLTLKRK
jgi:hypothetical protein